MGSILTIVAVALVFGGLQLAAGLIIGRSLRRPAGGVPPDEAERLQRFARQLHRLTASVAEDVEGHQRELGAATETLDTACHDGGLAETVIATVQRVMHVNRRLQHRLSVAEGKLEDQTRQIESSLLAAHTDVLTGLMNRRAFDAELERLATQLRRRGTPFGLLILDIDYFKQINDSYGHDGGDAVLETLGSTLERALQPPAQAARIGGEEFAILLPAAGPREARQVIDAIRAAIAAAPFRCGRTELSLTVSMGLALAAPDDVPGSVYRRADEALYASKRGGRNCAHYHNGQTCQPVLLAADELDFPAPAAQAALPEELATLCDELRHRLSEVAVAPTALVRPASSV
jgi:diguanylate cyclase